MNMKYLNEFSAWVVGIVGSMYSFITGHTDRAFQILLLCMVIDIISGVMKGLQNKNLKSSIMSIGIIKKAAIILSIIFAMLLDNLINSGKEVFSTMMTWLAIGNEGLSILENLTLLGVKIPKAISEKINQIVNEATDLQKEKDGEVESLPENTDQNTDQTDESNKSL